MTNISKGRKAPAKLKSMGDHDEFLNRITKSLYYAKLPMTDCLSLPVTELAAELFTEVKSGHTLERLDVEEASRISRNACVSPCSLVLALLYLERLKDCNSEYLHRVAPSELFLVSLMVASKFLHDDGEEDAVFNSEWAHSADLTIPKLNQLEKEFLKAIDWDVFVHNQDFWEKLQRLERDIAYKEARKRGWFSYTELSCLMNSVQLMAIAQTVINISTICLATYAAGIVTLLGSALVTSHLPGTLLSPRQSTISNHVTNIDVNTVVEADSAGSDNDTSHNVITVDISPAALKYNETCQDCHEVDAGNNNGSYVGNVKWEWWLNSVMVWLPEYSGLETTNGNLLITTEAKSERIDTFNLNTKHLFGTTPVTQDVDDFAIEVNWKEILGLDVKFSSNDWRYYADYFAKIGHWQ